MEGGGELSGRDDPGNIHTYIPYIYTVYQQRGIEVSSIRSLINIQYMLYNA